MFLILYLLFSSLISVFLTTKEDLTKPNRQYTIQEKTQNDLSSDTDHYANFGITALHAENEKRLLPSEQLNPLPKYAPTINTDYFSDFGSKAVTAVYYKNLTVQNEIPHAHQKPSLPMVEESAPQEISPPEENLTKNADHENLEELLELNKLHAIFEPINKATLSAQISSPVIKINKLMGESFDADEILIQLDDTVYQAYLSKWESALAKASTTLHAKQQLFQDGVSSLFDIKEAEAAVAAANAEVTLSKNQIQCCKIRAPYHGKVSSLSIQPYELPQVGQALIDIIGDQILIAHFLFDASNLSKISLNQPMDILVKETGQKIQAKIIRIGAVIDPASSTVKVDAEIDNHDLNLIAGMTGYASLIDVSTSFTGIIKDFYSQGPQQVAFLESNKIEEPIIKDHSVYLKGLTPQYEENHKIPSIEDSPQVSDALNECPNQDNLNDAINVDSIKTSLNPVDDDPLGRSLISQELSVYPNNVQIAPDQHFISYNTLEENPSLNIGEAVLKGALEYKFPESLSIEQPYGTINNVSALFQDVQPIDELIQPYVHETAKIKPIGQFETSQNALQFENIENKNLIEDSVPGQEILEEDEIQSQEEYVQTIMTLYQEEIVHTSEEQSSTDNESDHNKIEDPIIRDHEVFLYGLLPHHEIVYDQLNKPLEILIPVSIQTREMIKSPVAEKGTSPIETQKLHVENIQNGQPKKDPLTISHEFYLRELTPSYDMDVDILIHKPFSEKLNAPLQTLPQELLEIHFIGTGTSQIDLQKFLLENVRNILQTWQETIWQSSRSSQITQNEIFEDPLALDEEIDNTRQSREEYIQTILGLYQEAVFKAADMQTSNNNEFEIELPAAIELPDITEDIEKLRDQEFINEKLLN